VTSPPFPRPGRRALARRFASAASRLAPAALAVLSTAALAQSPAPSGPPTGTPAPSPVRFDASLVDRSIDPCEDFYRFACGRWQAANPIPADQAMWTTWSSLQIWNETILRETLEAAAARGAGGTPDERRIGDYWAACMDEASIERRGVEPIRADLAVVESVRARKDLARAVAHLHRTVPAAWGFEESQTPVAAFGILPAQDMKDSTLVVGQIDQGGMGLPGREFYLSKEPGMREMRARYRAHVERMLVLAGVPKARAARDAAAVLRIETALARAAMDPVTRRDPAAIYHPMPLAQVKSLAPTFDWDGYLSAVGAPAPAHWTVTAPGFLQGLQKLLASEPIEAWRAYLRWWTVHENARYLSRAFELEHFDFYSRTLAGARELQPRWRRCVRLADRDLGEALGHAYVARAFPPESKRRMDAMMADVVGALGRELDGLDWMEASTRAAARAKLAAIERKIGHPATWRDYSTVAISRASLVANVHAATGYELSRQLAKIGRPVDRAEWWMTPPTVNAWYDPQLNSINFPAGILQPPLFDPAADDPVNYGAIGMVIGHEIIHGFDDQGRKFDAKGNLADWWTAADARRFEERGACFVRQYTGEIPGLGVRQDGRLTLGEDASDAGGLRLAHAALAEAYRRQGRSLDEKGPDGWTARQRFFLGHAFSWCANLRPEAARTFVPTSPHSLPERRVNEVEANLPEFREAFACKSGSRMVREPACRIW